METNQSLPVIEIVEDVDVETNGDDCQYCAGKRHC